MLRTLALANYRSLLNFTVPLGRLNVITGPNGSGKSNLYRALRLLSETAQGGVVNALAREGGIQSSLWAGPENISREMKDGTVPVQGGPRKKKVRLRLGFTGEDFGYAISLGLPPHGDRFSLDPQIKRECIWAGEILRPASLLVDRDGPLIRVRGDDGWENAFQGADAFNSMFSEIADPRAAPEVHLMRRMSTFSTS